MEMIVAGGQGLSPADRWAWWSEWRWRWEIVDGLQHAETDDGLADAEGHDDGAQPHRQAGEGAALGSQAFRMSLRKLNGDFFIRRSRALSSRQAERELAGSSGVAERNVEGILLDRR
jgi:hypothetical protein